MARGPILPKVEVQFAFRLNGTAGLGKASIALPNDGVTKGFADAAGYEVGRAVAKELKKVIASHEKAETA